MNNCKGITLLLMIFILFILTAGAASVANQIAVDVKAARDYLEETKAFYIAWSAVANGRTWMTSSGAADRRVQIGNATACSGGSNGTTCEQIVDRDFLPDATPDFDYGDRSFTYEIQAGDDFSYYGDGRIKVVGDYPATDRIATRDPRLRKALLEMKVWRDMKAFDDPNNNPATGATAPVKAIDLLDAAGTPNTGTWWEFPLTGGTRWLYVDFGWRESCREVQVQTRTISGTATVPDGGTGSITFQSWDDLVTPPNWSAAIAISGWAYSGGGANNPRVHTATFTSSVTARRLRINVTPNAGQSANLIHVEVRNAAGGTNVRRRGTVRPGRFSFSSDYSHTSFQ